MEIFGIPLESLFGLMSAGLTVALAIVGPKVSKYRKVLKVIMDATEDDKITEKEVKEIVKAVKALF